MWKKIKAEIQIFSILLLGTIGLVLLALIIGLNSQQLTVTAQEPIDTPPYPPHIGAEDPAAFGLSLDDIQAASETFDLEVEITPHNITALSGSTVQFTVSITNNGPDPASFILFYNDFPKYISNVSAQFSVTGVISDSQPKPTWLLPGPINPGNAVQVTINGRVDAKCDVVAPNTVIVYPFNSASEPPGDPNNTDTAIINISNQTQCLYLPQVLKIPTPTPIPVLFFDNFSDDKSGWPEFDKGGCNVDYQDNEYHIKADADTDCFAFAPDDAEYRYAIFEVEARRGSDSGNDFSYGIYINGRGGGEYYLFRVHPEDNCGWQLIRRKSDHSDTVSSGGCASAIKRNDGRNVLKIKHTSNGLITVYVNNTQLATYQDNSQLTDTGTGVYVQTDNDRNVEVKFDNFTVLNP